MIRSLPIRNAISALVLLAPLFSGRVAFAQQACGDTTCPKGFSCETEASGGCAAIDCVEGPCPEPCVVQNVSVCRPGPCSADADCADGMACAIVEQTNCTGGAAEPACADGACPELPSKDLTCSTTTSKQCLPRWTLPCVADADCGAGFNCKEQQQCSTPGTAGPGSSGSGSSGSSGSAGAADPVPPAPTPTPSASTTPSEPPVTTCEPSGIKSCEPIRVACSADSGCPSGWSCRDNPEGTCWADSNGNTGCTPADPAKLCFPPYADLLEGGGGPVGVDGSATPSTPVKGETAGGTPVDYTGVSVDRGCSIGGTQATSRNALAWCVALGAALGLSRRARRRRPSTNI